MIPERPVGRKKGDVSMSNEEKRELKNALIGYRHINAATQKRLRALGFSIEIGKKHTKIRYGKRLYVMPASPSDHRSGLNAAMNLIRMVEETAA